MPSLSRLYVVVGPTASGKTALAINLAQQVGGCVINMDSMQLYRELPILTAQPSAAEQGQAPHMLYGVRPASEPANAAWWASEAKQALTAAKAGGQVPILCGGTGLYLQTLLDGIAPVPEIPAEVRAEGTALIARDGVEALHAELDPAMQAKLQSGDTQRVLRAWEVLHATGRSLADWQAEPHLGALEDYDVRILVLNPDRAALYARCDARFGLMLEAGALDEVGRLAAQNLPPELPLLKACGYPELAAHLKGELPLAQAISAGQQATRNYAKRQITWFTNQLLEKRANALGYAGFGGEGGAQAAFGL